MKVVGLDTETTGLKVEDGHKIIEIALITMDTDTGEITDRFVRRCNPGRAIDAAATAVHGISASELVNEPTFAEIADDVIERMASADLVIAHNMDFDAPFLAQEMVDAGRKPPEVDLFCTMENGRWATPMGKIPNLGELCWACKVDYDPSAAHAADYDVEVMLQAFLFGLRNGFFVPQSAAA